ncbi:hypothetical protein B0H14DRAFT_2608535 [Mycena olivaceomarginata]|nr:hypothetical protein B0H14DRAFT_2608535 [Mycena olivaceomarginata]
MNEEEETGGQETFVSSEHYALEECITVCEIKPGRAYEGLEITVRSEENNGGNAENGYAMQGQLWKIARSGSAIRRTETVKSSRTSRNEEWNSSTVSGGIGSAWSLKLIGESQPKNRIWGNSLKTAGLANLKGLASRTGTSSNDERVEPVHSPRWLNDSQSMGEDVGIPRNFGGFETTNKWRDSPHFLNLAPVQSTAEVRRSVEPPSNNCVEELEYQSRPTGKKLSHELLNKFTSFRILDMAAHIIGNRDIQSQKDITDVRCRLENFEHRNCVSALKARLVDEFPEHGIVSQDSSKRLHLRLGAQNHNVVEQWSRYTEPGFAYK